EAVLLVDVINEHPVAAVFEVVADPWCCGVKPMLQWAGLGGLAHLAAGAMQGGPCQEVCDGDYRPALGQKSIDSHGRPSFFCVAGIPLRKGRSDYSLRQVTGRLPSAACRPCDFASSAPRTNAR